MNSENTRHTGSEPNIGTFEYRIDSTGTDWTIVVLTSDGQRIERWCSVWSNEPCKGKTRVYEILRSLGFNIEGTRL